MVSKQPTRPCDCNTYHNTLITSKTNSALIRFRNIPSGQSFTPNNKSGDYSLQLMMGMQNHIQWQQDQKLIPGATKYSFNTDWKLRTGPTMDYTDVPPCDFEDGDEAAKK